MNRNVAFYILTAVFFGSLLWLVFSQGIRLEATSSPNAESNGLSPVAAAVDHDQEAARPGLALNTFLTNVTENTAQPLSRLLLQVVVIIVLARALTFLMSKIGQPQVIGEIVAGIILGPSVVGLFWPGISGFLFEPESLTNLHFLSQLGLILFMFIIGLELDVHVLKHKAQTALLVSYTSIIFPFFCGVTLSYFLYKLLAPPQISFLAFGLFMGIAMSITAFPVLARILHERGMSQSPIGTLALTSAAVGDVSAWCILAAVIAIVQAGSIGSAVFTVLISLLYVLVMLTIVRPWIQRLGDLYSDGENLSRGFAVVAFGVLFLSAFASEVIGIHALFGAFLAGVIMPAQATFRKTLASKIEDVSLVILLPLFFAFTGLKTQIGLLNDAYDWLICGLIISVAIAGKVGGSLAAARFTGQSWSDSLAIGALMNTRGLMELIVLNIGYDLGVLSPKVFTMLVLMALVTTFVTSPALSLIEQLKRKREQMRAYPIAERM